MTHEEAFLAAIREAVEDDAPRLIYADWLDERGEGERAEFIRVQCRIADVNAELLSDEDCGDPHCEGCKERRILQEREQELFPIIAGRYYLPRFPAGSMVEQVEYAYRRGFVDAVTCTAVAWLLCGAVICKAQPVRKVRLSDRKPWTLNAALGDKAVWHWFAEQEEITSLDVVLSAARLPPEIWRAYVEVFPERHKGHTSEGAACDALSQACLLMAGVPLAGDEKGGGVVPKNFEN